MHTTSRDAMCAAPAAYAQNETHVYGIANFGGPGECGSSGMTHPVHADTAAAFAGVFTFLKIFGFWAGIGLLAQLPANGCLALSFCEVISLKVGWFFIARSIESFVAS